MTLARDEPVGFRLDHLDYGTSASFVSTSQAQVGGGRQMWMSAKRREMNVGERILWFGATWIFLTFVFDSIAEFGFGAPIGIGVAGWTFGATALLSLISRGKNAST